MSRTKNRRDRGFTLIELLIVVAIIGIIAAIAIPNLFHALHMAKQKRSFSDLRTITLALSVYRIDHSRYPLLGDTNSTALVPFVGEVPEWDGWNNRFAYQCGGDGTEYTAVSYGSNRKADKPYVMGPITRHVDDLVYTGGALLQWPEGTQADS